MLKLPANAQMRGEWNKDHRTKPVAKARAIRRATANPDGRCADSLGGGYNIDSCRGG